MSESDTTIDLGNPRDGFWEPGERAIFTYSLAFDPASDIGARLHHRTGQAVTVVERGQDDCDDSGEFATLAARADAASLRVYEIRFEDGHVDTAFEDELRPELRVDDWAEVLDGSLDSRRVSRVEDEGRTIYLHIGGETHAGPLPASNYRKVR